MGERVIFEYIADDGEGGSGVKVSGDFMPKASSFAGCCGEFIYADDNYRRHIAKISRRARQRVKKTLDMIEDLYDEIFSE